MELSPDERSLLTFLKKWCPTPTHASKVRVGTSWMQSSHVRKDATAELERLFTDWSRFLRVAKALADRGLAKVEENKASVDIWCTEVGIGTLDPVTPTDPAPKADQEPRVPPGDDEPALQSQAAGDPHSRHRVNWPFFLVGVVLFTFTLALLAVAFVIGDLTPDQRSLLRWLLPLTSGFTAGAFAGSFTVMAKSQAEASDSSTLLPSFAATATGGFAVWLLTHFLWKDPTPDKVKETPTVPTMTKADDEKRERVKPPVINTPDPVKVVLPVSPVNIEDEKDQGNTRVKGRVKITQDGDKIVIEIEVSTKRRGPGGTASGATQVLLVDKDGNPVFSDTVSKTVGADFIKGLAEKGDSKRTVLPKDKSERVAAAAFGIVAAEGGSPPTDELGARLADALRSPDVKSQPLNQVEHRMGVHVVRLR